MSNIEHDPVKSSPQAIERAQQRTLSEYDVASMPWLPQLPETWAEEIYERVEEAERRFAAPNLRNAEYEDGTATKPDEIAFITKEVDSTGYLFTAEHATTPFSLKTKKMRDYPDAGTGGLTAVLARNHGTGLIMRGKQTSNVPSDPEHPIKPIIARYLPQADGFLSVHGMARGKFMDPLDRTEVQASIGLGDEPTEEMQEFAEAVVKHARDELGLYVVIGNDGKYYVQKEGTTEVKRNDDGTPYRSRLAALGTNKSTNFARRELASIGRSVPAMQIELTKFLRLAAVENETRDRVAKVIGVALGYKLLESVVELSGVEKR